MLLALGETVELTSHLQNTASTLAITVMPSLQHSLSLRCLLKQRMMEVVSGDNWTTGATSRAKLQTNHHHHQHPVFKGRMPFCHPTNSVKALKGKYHIPSICWGLPTLSLTTSSSWLPWGRVPMPLISPLMPVPHKLTTL